MKFHKLTLWSRKSRTEIWENWHNTDGLQVLEVCATLRLHEVIYVTSKILIICSVVDVTQAEMFQGVGTVVTVERWGNKRTTIVKHARSLAAFKCWIDDTVEWSDAYMRMAHCRTRLRAAEQMDSEHWTWGRSDGSSCMSQERTFYKPEMRLKY